MNLVVLYKAVLKELEGLKERTEGLVSLEERLAKLELRVPEKRKRGRPRKNPEEPKVPKKRGRPKKV